MSQQDFKVRQGPGADHASYALGEALNKWFSAYGPGSIFANCENCKHMAEQGPAFCTLYKTTPPVAVIMAGCPSHEDKEDIPF